MSTDMASGDSPTKVRSDAVLAIVLVGAFLGQFDVFVVNVAAPSIQRALHASDVELQLIVAGYAFTFAGALITGGRLGDMFGYRRVYVCGLVGFAATTLLCGLMPSAPALIGARLLEGFAAGALIPQVLASITTYLPADKRLPAMGWYGAATGTGSIVGQFAGGALVAWAGWRTIFFVAVPIATFTAAAAHRWLPRRGLQASRSFDILGSLGLAAGLGLVMLAILLGTNGLSPAETATLAAVGVGLLGLSLGWERRLLQRGGDPAVNLRLLRLASLWRGLLGVTMFMLYFGSFLYLLTNALQRGLGLSPLHAALVFVPSGITFASSSLSFRRWSAAHQLRSITIGSLITITGLGIAAAGTLTDTAPVVFLLAGVIGTGLGNGLTLPVLIGYALTDVPRAQAGVGSALVSTVQQFAYTLGITVFGTIFYAIANDHDSQLVDAIGWCLLAYILLLLAVIVITRTRHHQTTAPDYQPTTPVDTPGRVTHAWKGRE